MAKANSAQITRPQVSIPSDESPRVAIPSSEVLQGLRRTHALESQSAVYSRYNHFIAKAAPFLRRHYLVTYDQAVLTELDSSGYNLLFYALSNPDIGVIEDIIARATELNVLADLMAMGTRNVLSYAVALQAKQPQHFELILATCLSHQLLGDDTPEILPLAVKTAIDYKNQGALWRLHRAGIPMKGLWVAEEVTWTAANYLLSMPYAMEYEPMLRYLLFNVVTTSTERMQLLGIALQTQAVMKELSLSDAHASLTFMLTKYPHIFKECVASLSEDVRASLLGVEGAVNPFADSIHTDLFTGIASFFLPSSGPAAEAAGLQVIRELQQQYYSIATFKAVESSHNRMLDALFAQMTDLQPGEFNHRFTHMLKQGVLAYEVSEPDKYRSRLDYTIHKLQQKPHKEAIHAVQQTIKISKSLPQTDKASIQRAMDKALGIQRAVARDERIESGVTLVGAAIGTIIAGFLGYLALYALARPVTWRKRAEHMKNVHFIAALTNPDNEWQLVDENHIVGEAWVLTTAKQLNFKATNGRQGILPQNFRVQKSLVPGLDAKVFLELAALEPVKLQQLCDKLQREEQAKIAAPTSEPVAALFTKTLITSFTSFYPLDVELFKRLVTELTKIQKETVGEREATAKREAKRQQEALLQQERDRQAAISREQAQQRLAAERAQQAAAEAVEAAKNAREEAQRLADETARQAYLAEQERQQRVKEDAIRLALAHEAELEAQRRKQEKEDYEAALALVEQLKLEDEAEQAAAAGPAPVVVVAPAPIPEFKDWLKLNSLTWGQIQAWRKATLDTRTEADLKVWLVLQGEEVVAQIKDPPKPKPHGKGRIVDQAPIVVREDLSYLKALPLYNEARNAYLAISAVLADPCADPARKNLYLLYQLIHLFGPLAMMGPQHTRQVVARDNAYQIRDAIRHMHPQQLMEHSNAVTGFATHVRDQLAGFFHRDAPGWPAQPLALPPIFTEVGDYKYGAAYDHATAQALIAIAKSALTSAQKNNQSESHQVLMYPPEEEQALVVATALSMLLPMLTKVKGGIPKDYRGISRHVGHHFTQEAQDVDGHIEYDPCQEVNPTFTVDALDKRQLYPALKWAEGKVATLGKGNDSKVQQLASRSDVAGNAGLRQRFG
jgi:hypothetical protein